MRISLSFVMGAFFLFSACGQSEGTALAPFVITGDTISAPLSETIASPIRGEQIFTERTRGHCVLCHQVASNDAPFQGNVGPDLSSVGARLTAGQIRLRIVDSSRINADTVMPPYYRNSGLNQVATEHVGTSVLKPEEIEDLVAYLTGLKG